MSKNGHNIEMDWNPSKNPFKVIMKKAPSDNCFLLLIIGSDIVCRMTLFIEKAEKGSIH